MFPSEFEAGSVIEIEIRQDGYLGIVMIVESTGEIVRANQVSANDTVANKVNLNTMRAIP